MALRSVSGPYLCAMPLSPQQEEFMAWWEKNRDKEKRTFRQLVVGLPLGLIFASPIILNFIASRFWYRRAEAVGNSQFNPAVLLIAAAAIAAFVAIMNKKLKWEQHEQYYLSLKARKEDENDPGS
jgi:hypothetical protein